MSLAALTWAFNQNLVPAQKVVLLALADYADDEGKCWPGQETLTRKTSLSVRSIRSQIRALEEAGMLLTIERRKDGGARATNAYQLAFGQPADPAGCGSLPARHADDNRHTVAGIAEPSVEPSDTPIVPTELEYAQLQFEDVWTWWPKKAAKKDALKVWLRICKNLGSIEVSDLAVKVRRHGEAHKKHTPSQFVPMLSTWLNGERWSDDLAQPRTPQPGGRPPVRQLPPGVHQNDAWMYV